LPSEITGPAAIRSIGVGISGKRERVRSLAASWQWCAASREPWKREFRYSAE